MICNLCPRQCNAPRSDTENELGFCKMPLLPTVARADLHFWEEPVISGENGSGTVFFSGCSLACVFCQNEPISQNRFGKQISHKRLAEIFKELENKGAHNINLVSPTHYALAIKKALDIYRPNIPIVYNSSGYEMPQTIKMLEGYIDIFLMDFKYFSDENAKEYSKADNYSMYAKKAILECYRQQPNPIIENGIMKKGVIIRHLLLPSATREAIAVFDWVNENAKNSYFSIMSQYIPQGKAKEIPKLNRKVTKREYEKVVDYIVGTGNTNVFVQEYESANIKYIPKFDLYGV